MSKKPPLLAVLGHPNEGKSSVVSTLAEDDSVAISPRPGETRVCREYPVVIDGEVILRFVDTPGFQNPRRSLEWMEGYAGPGERLPAEFIRVHQKDERFSDECELLAPLADGAGIIFVVDGSRPVRRTDLMEMEILRKTGLPRMIVINPREKTTAATIETWKHEARKHFNTVRLFDAHQAGFALRIDLLESLKHIDPDWQPALESAISAFKADWQQRLEETAAMIDQLLQTAVNHTIEKTCRDESRVKTVHDQLLADFQQQAEQFEKQAQARIKKRFKHNIFAHELPPQSILEKDLFDKATWQVLGLTRRQMALAGAGVGAGIGANIDLALAGLSFGVFTTAGSILGAGSVAAGMKKLATARIRGLPLGGIKVQIGPVESDQLLYVLTDRCLVYFSHVINWAHSRRDRPRPGEFGDVDIPAQLSAGWDREKRHLSRQYFKALRQGDGTAVQAASARFRRMLLDILREISGWQAGIQA